MRAMVSSVKDKGVTQPAIVRPREDGGYEIVSGHRRQKASELAGYADMPCIVRNLTDDEAITQMVEDNLNQREEILPSERAKALKMQLEAIKHQGSRTSGQIDPKDAGKRSNEIVAERNKMAVKQVQRYIRLNELVPDLMKLMDEKNWALLRRWSFPISARRTRTISPSPLTASSPRLHRRRQSVCGNWTKRSCSTGM